MLKLSDFSELVKASFLKFSRLWIGQGSMSGYFLGWDWNVYKSDICGKKYVPPSRTTETAVALIKIQGTYYARLFIHFTDDLGGSGNTNWVADLTSHIRCLAPPVDNGYHLESFG